LNFKNKIGLKKTIIKENNKKRKMYLKIYIGKNTFKKDLIAKYKGTVILVKVE